jgi:hypothetical protein
MGGLVGYDWAEASGGRRNGKMKIIRKKLAKYLAALNFGCAHQFK